MKKVILLALGAFMFCSVQAQTTDNGNKYENSVQVSGKAEREVVPDEIYVRIIIDEQNLKNRQSVQQLEQEMIAKLRSIGIDTDRDLTIENMTSTYKDYLLSKNNPKTAAAYQLKVDSAGQLTRVFQAVESLGISNMSITRLSHSRIKEIQNEIRIEAMKNAQEIAAALAGAVGQEVCRAVYIVDYNSDISPYETRPDVMLMRARADSSNDYETELGFKNIKISYNLTVKFELL